MQASYHDSPFAYLAAINTTLTLFLHPFALRPVSLQPRLVPSNSSIATITIVQTYEAPTSDAEDQVRFRDSSGELIGYYFHAVTTHANGQLIWNAGGLGDGEATCSTANYTFAHFPDISPLPFGRRLYLQYSSRVYLS